MIEIILKAYRLPSLLRQFELSQSQSVARVHTTSRQVV
ncbi:hypothetical protein AM1_B0370 (plasmid) [Acaryochloris marina MBIC11017]|uniref:Uncharacterized protein n=1 Tax=Acaryochloris marina (strain MBIC 11017) TaxID=329726 RepID=A8ZLR1_ACAM1|nr:hypothetical protein AM1_B0370 [Acaryochloris marina MBIC11017]